MRYYLSLLLYHIGDILSTTCMTWGRGYGYEIYKKVMLLSCDLDKEGKIWKYIKPKKKKEKKKK